MRVAIDAGHGSNTAGKRTPDGYREHYINVMTADFLNKALLRCGFSTTKIAWDDLNSKDDEDVPLSTRQKQVKNAKCDLSVSCHANAFGPDGKYNSAHGVETLYYNNTSISKDSKKLAEIVQKHIIQGTPQANRGAKPQQLAMCNCVKMGTKASVLVEIAFMSNKEESALLKTATFCKEQAEQIAAGVCEYCGIKYVTSDNPSKKIDDARDIVKALQSALNKSYGTELVVDGIRGPKTNEVIKKYYVVNFTANAYAKWIQNRLASKGYKLEVDGKYGPGTALVVKSFQKKEGLKVDGIAGYNTVTKLI